MALTKRRSNFPDQLRSGIMGTATAVLRGQALVQTNPTTDDELVQLGAADNAANFAGVAYQDSAGIGTEIPFVAGGDVDVKCSGAVTAQDALVVAANGSFKTAAVGNKNVVGHATMSGADGDIISAHINQTRGLAVS